MDQSKKTMRHFYCRDVLWETFEQMANDFDCSIDYLVNEAMRYYARSKNYNSPGAPGAGPGGQAPNVTGGSPAVGNTAPASYPGKPAATTAPQPRNQAGTQPPPPSAMTTSPAPRRPAPPTPGYAAAPSATGGLGATTRNQPGVSNMGGMQPHANSSASPIPAPMPGGSPTLFLIYNGQRYPVTKDQFIIGRGSKTSDLPIKDGNISRKHAAVIRRNGTFYIKDLGSTNGIDYKGMRIDNKRIDEGDVFHLCDYELRFTYRAD
ncbi:MAG TPA: FHA domain-containing protein [Kofleriaceae bacterium]|nr:FHA domain-containing protein [Kofleriaceae bacterium]